MMATQPAQLERGMSIKDPRFREIINEIARQAARDVLAGPGILVDDETVSAVQQPRLWFHGKVTASASVSGEPNRWTYTVIRQVQSASGYGNWSDDPGGFTVTARNKYEDPNSGSGREGNGVNVDNLPDGWEMYPIQVGTPVTVFESLCGDGETNYWFESPNAVDGVCP